MNPIIWSSNLWNGDMVRATTQKSTKTIKLRSLDGTTVTVHKGLLFYFSKYYRAALSEKFSDAKKDTFDVELSAANLERFKIWLDTGIVQPAEPQYNSCMCESHVRLYIFADQTDNLALRRTVMNLFVSKHTMIPLYDTVALVYTNLPESSPLRQNVPKSYITHWTPENDEKDDYMEALERDTEGVVQGFMYELCIGVADRQEVHPERCVCCERRCEYHEHESAEEWSHTCGPIQFGGFRLSKEFVDESSNEDELVEELE